MRLTSVVPLLSALHLALPCAFARLDRPLRQHHKSRALLDVCAYIDADTLAQNNIIGIPADILVDLDLCLCLSALPLALKTNANLKVLTGLLGNTAVDAFLSAIINSAPGSQHCTYPAHSTPLCSMNDPCGHSCNPPYVPRVGHCDCPPPYFECNGQCGHFPKGCGSAVPRSRRQLKAVNTHGVRTLEDAQLTCTSDETVCGVDHGSARFECLDTEVTLQSCGGCVIPHSFSLSSEQVSVGIDCSALSDVLDVQCLAGKCVVDRCRNGFEISLSRDACIQEGVPSPAPLVKRVKRNDDVRGSIDTSLALGASNATTAILEDALELTDIDTGVTVTAVVSATANLAASVGLAAPKSTSFPVSGDHQPSSSHGSNPSLVGSRSTSSYDDLHATLEADGGHVRAAVLDDISPKSLSDLVSVSSAPDCLDFGSLPRSDEAQDLFEEEGNVLANLTTTSAELSGIASLASAIELLHDVDVKIDYIGKTN